MASPKNGHPHYVHPRQRVRIRQLSRTLSWRTEWPTWVLMVVIYTGWFAVVHYWAKLGSWLATPLLILLTTWYLSFQHELIHGHPTRYPRLNQLLGMMPLAVWYPYGLYRDSHLRHHYNERLTLPEQDPEGYYFSQARWQQFSPWVRRVVRLRNTFCGRLAIGPLIDIVQTAIALGQALRHGDGRALAMWLLHGLLLAALLYWMAGSALSIGWFLLAISYPALSLTKVRSFLEHRAAPDASARSVINEAAWPWRLLFLNLNYHLVHHDLPAVPWFALRRVYLEERQHYLTRCQGFMVQGYGAWLQQYAFTPVAVEAHPDGLRAAANIKESPADHADIFTDVRYQPR